MSLRPGQSYRVEVALKLPRSDVPGFIAYARSIVHEMTDNRWFPDPQPALAVVSASIDELELAQVATLSRTLGTRTIRDRKRKVVATLLRQLAFAVEAVADANPEHSRSIIESAGMFVKRTRVYPSRIFAAKRGRVSGSVTLVAPRAARTASYEWAYRRVGDLVWQMAPVTVRSTTTIGGLTRGTTVELRYRVTTKDGTGDWSDVIRFVVE